MILIKCRYTCHKTYVQFVMYILKQFDITMFHCTYRWQRFR